MKLEFPSDAWIKELSAQLNQSPAYAQAAKDWEGDFTFILESDAVCPEEAYLFLGLYHGHSPDAAQLATVDERAAEYIIRAPYSTWRRIIEGKLDPIQGLMTKQLKLTGNMMMVMRYPKAAKEIMACCSHIPTTFLG